MTISIAKNALSTLNIRCIFVGLYVDDALESCYNKIFTWIGLLLRNDEEWYFVVPWSNPVDDKWPMHPSVILHPALMKGGIVEPTIQLSVRRSCEHCVGMTLHLQLTIVQKIRATLLTSFQTFCQSRLWRDVVSDVTSNVYELGKEGF